MRPTLAAIFIILSITLAAFGVNLGTSWTYQGQLRRSGSAYTGSCNFQFSLWDSATGGTQTGNTQSLNSVAVTNGLFTVTLDFGDQFAGSSRWLATSVQCSGDPGFTALDPRQAITAAPAALTLRPNASIYDSVASAPVPPALSIISSAGTGVDAQGFVGVYGASYASSGKGVYGFANGNGGDAVFGYGSGPDGSGVHGLGQTGAKAGVLGDTTNPNGSGVYGNATGAGSNSSGVFGLNSSGAAIWGRSTGAGSAVYGENTSNGYAGRFVGPVDVTGRVTVNLTGDNVTAIQANTFGINATAVYGQASAAGSAGVFGLNNASAAIWGRSTGAGSAIFGENTSTGFAGRFIGPVSIQGTLSKSAGTFKIDHPLDPANKFLSHSFVESPEMMNIYNGNVATDASGHAIVRLPEYFAALNRDYRYQLTVLGQFAQAIVSRKIAGNSFEIRTDKPGVEVSWQVTGVRQDAYAKDHPIKVEELKSAEEKGSYLYPGGFGASEEQRIGYSPAPEAPQDRQKAGEQAK